MLSVLHSSIWSTTRNPHLARALGAVLLGTAFCYAGLAAINVLVQPLGRFDESIQILAARAIGAGLVPHRDFWFVYPDLNPWIIAAAFKLFGASYIVARSVSLMFYALVLTVAWMAVKPQLSRPVFMLGLTLGIAKLVAYSPWNAFALVLVLLLWICSDQWKVPSVVWLMRGMVVACCLLMRINFGGYVLIAMVSVISLNREISVRDKRTQGICLCAPVICAVVLYCGLQKQSASGVQPACRPATTCAQQGEDSVRKHPFCWSARAPASYYSQASSKHSHSTCLVLCFFRRIGGYNYA